MEGQICGIQYMLLFSQLLGCLCTCREERRCFGLRGGIARQDEMEMKKQKK